MFSIIDNKIYFEGELMSTHPTYEHLCCITTVFNLARDLIQEQSFTEKRPGSWMGRQKNDSGIKWSAALKSETHRLSIKTGIANYPVLIVSSLGRYAKTYITFPLAIEYLKWLVPARFIGGQILNFTRRISQTRSEIEFKNYIESIIEVSDYNIKSQFSVGKYRVDFAIYSDSYKILALIEYDESRHERNVGVDKLRWTYIKSVYPKALALRLKEHEQYRFIADLSKFIFAPSIDNKRVLKTKYRGYL